MRRCNTHNLSLSIYHAAFIQVVQSCKEDVIRNNLEEIVKNYHEALLAVPNSKVPPSFSFE